MTGYEIPLDKAEEFFKKIFGAIREVHIYKPSYWREDRYPGWEIELGIFNVHIWRPEEHQIICSINPDTNFWMDLLSFNYDDIKFNPEVSGQIRVDDLVEMIEACDGDSAKLYE